MRDFLMMVMLILAFAAACGYVLACTRMTRPPE